MSVPKSRRGESPAQYIDLAREIYVFTYNRVRLLPKAYTFYFSLPLYNAARTAYRLVSETVGRYDYRRNLSNFQNQAERQRPIGRSRHVSI